jgi:hypothetical protein
VTGGIKLFYTELANAEIINNKYLNISSIWNRVLRFMPVYGRTGITNVLNHRTSKYS